MRCRVQGNLEDMLEDCNTGIAWVIRHIGSRGGDPSQIYMVGQSAGGQLGSLALIAQVSAGGTCQELMRGLMLGWSLLFAAACGCSASGHGASWVLRRAAGKLRFELCF